MEQKYTSEDTSIKTINRVYKEINTLGLNKGDTIFDYGCGKFNDMKEIALLNGYKWYGFDKFNRSKKENLKSSTLMKQKAPELIINSNVLNVIAEDEIIEEIVRDISTYCNENTKVIFTIYEGNRTGDGKITSKGYQRNQKAIEYLDVIGKYFIVNKKKGNIIYCMAKDVVTSKAM